MQPGFCLHGRHDCTIRNNFVRILTIFSHKRGRMSSRKVSTDQGPGIPIRDAFEFESQTFVARVVDVSTKRCDLCTWIETNQSRRPVSVCRSKWKQNTLLLTAGFNNFVTNVLFAFVAMSKLSKISTDSIFLFEIKQKGGGFIRFRPYISMSRRQGMFFCSWRVQRDEFLQESASAASQCQLFIARLSSCSQNSWCHFCIVFE
jgi:hypothetical protein